MSQSVHEVIIKLSDQATKQLQWIQGNIKAMWKEAENFVAKNRDGIVALWAASTTVFAALGSSVYSSIQTFSDFENKMSWVKAVLSPTSDEFSRLQSLVRQLWKDTKFSAMESADAVEVLAKNGMNASQILDGTLQQTLNLAAATWTEIPIAADIATSAMLAFKLEAKDLWQVVNSVTGTTNLSKFGIEDYSLALAQWGWVASAVWVNFRDFNASIAAISPLFNSWMDAGTSFKTMLLRLVPQSNEASDAMKELWLITQDWSNKFFDATGKMKSMAEVSQLLHDATVWLSDQQKNLYLSTIFWTDSLRAAAWMANMTAEEFNKLSQSIESTNAAENAAVRMDNLKGIFEQLSGTIDELMISLWSALMPTIKTFSSVLISVVTAVGNFVSQNQTLSAVLLTVATVFSWLLAVATWIWLILPSIIAWFSAIGAILAAISGPIGWTIAGITALGVAWSTNFLGIRDITTSVWEWIKGTFQAWIDWILTTFAPFFAEVRKFWDENGAQIMAGLQIFWSFIKVIFSQWMDYLKLYLGTAWEAIKLVFGVAFDLIALAFKNFFAILSGIMTAAMQILNGDWSGAWETIKGTFVTVGENIVEAWQSVFQRFHDVVTGIVARVQEFVGWSLQRIKDTISEIMTLGNANTGTYNGGGVQIDGARASGGPVRAWGTYLVGEKGPELFTAPRSWNIIPNNALGGSASVNINISGVSINNGMDLDSFASRLKSEIARSIELSRLSIA